MSLLDPKVFAGEGVSELPQSQAGLILDVIQKGSPEFDETHKKHKERGIEGCKPGQFTLDGTAFSGPLLVIPLASTQFYSEWKPQASGGGFVGLRTIEEVTSSRAYRKGIPGTKTEHSEYLGDNELKYTISYAVLAFFKDMWQKIRIDFTSTGLKDARLWGRLIKQTKYPGFKEGTSPIFCAKYRLTTSPRSNTSGSWFGIDISRDEVLEKDEHKDLLALAIESRKEAVLALPKPQVQQQIENSPAPAATQVVDDKEAF